MYYIGFGNFITLHVTTMFIVQFLTLSLENKKKFFEKFVGNHTPTLKKCLCWCAMLRAASSVDRLLYKYNSCGIITFQLRVGIHMIAAQDTNVHVTTWQPQIIIIGLRLPIGSHTVYTWAYNLTYYSWGPVLVSS